MALYVDTALRAGRVAAPAVVRTFIKSESFDTALLALPILAGLCAAGTVLADARLFAVLLIADLWLLGYHHVVATYTRLAFTADTLRRNRFMAVDLLVLMMTGTVAVALTAGAWVVSTAFLYLQWFHYMRQGYGISRMYFRATSDGREAGARDLLTELVLYLVPIYGIAFRSATMGDRFLEYPVKTLVLPPQVIALLGVAAFVAVSLWAVRAAASLARGTLDVLYAAFVVSHVAIFMVAYVAIEDANVGWLAINVWHNFQYVMVVWMVNAKRYAGGVDPTARFLSSISQPGRVAAYFTSCLAISTLVYLVLGRFVAAVGGGLALTVGLYMGINFHHYIVDALIWRRKKAAAQPA